MIFGVVFMVFAAVFGIMAVVMFRQNEKRDGGVYLNGQKVEGEEAEKVLWVGKLIMFGIVGLFFVVGLGMTVIPMLDIRIDPYWILAAVPFVLGLIFIGVAMIIKKLNQGVTRDGIVVVGTIEGVERDSRMDADSNFHIRYMPVVRYFYQGKEYCGKAMIGARRPSVYQVGESVELQVNPDTPQLFHLAQDNKSAGVLFWVFFLVGLLCVVLGIGAAVLVSMLPRLTYSMLY